MNVKQSERFALPLKATEQQFVSAVQLVRGRLQDDDLAFGVRVAHNSGAMRVTLRRPPHDPIQGSVSIPFGGQPSAQQIYPQGFWTVQEMPIDTVVTGNGELLAVGRATDAAWEAISPIWAIIEPELEQLGFLAPSSPPARGADRPPPLPRKARLQFKPAGANPDQDNDNAYRIIVEHEGTKEEAYKDAYDYWLWAKRRVNNRASRQAFDKAMTRAEERATRTQ